MKKQSILLCISLLFAQAAHAAIPRIAFLNDASASQDADDVAAIPVQVALMAAFGATEKLVHWSYNCDYIAPLIVDDVAGQTRLEILEDSLRGAIIHWGQGDIQESEIFNCRIQTKKDDAIAHLAAQINLSSATDPLWIIEAGEPDILGYALDAANASAREFVKVVTHHTHNDGGKVYHLNNNPWKDGVVNGVRLLDISQFPGMDMTPTDDFIARIGDQNVELHAGTGTGLAPLAGFSWMTSSTDPRIEFLEARAIKAAAGAFKPDASSIDVSDAGMVWFVLDGGPGVGDETPSATKIGDKITAWAAANPAITLPSPWQTADIGGSLTGSASVLSSGFFNVQGAGTFSNGVSTDECRFVYQTLTGGGKIKVRINSRNISNLSSSGGRAGIMIRETLDPGSKYAMLALRSSGSSTVRFMRRLETNAVSLNSSYPSLSTPNCWFEIERVNNTITVRRSSDNSTWSSNSQSIPMSANALIGFVVCSDSDTTLDSAEFELITVIP